MSQVSRLARASNAFGVAEWSDLVDEFDRWGDAGRVASLWWRDDDASDATPELDRLLALADAPIALAVIPALAQPRLAVRLATVKQITVVQHGWRHADHAMGGKKSEYPAIRPAEEIVAELKRGRARLADLFDGRFAPILVPPWNRIAREILPLLPEAGLAGVSVMASRDPTDVPPGLAAIDVHVDLVAWTRGRGFVGDAHALGGLVAALRRMRSTFSARPVGILTHHLVMDTAGGDFLARLCAIVRGHRAARWAAVGEGIMAA